MTRAIDYDSTQIPAGYDRARSHSPEVTNLWLRTVARFIQSEPVCCILDLGCGTGRFSGPLAKYFASAVVGIDPSQRMLDQAKAKAAGLYDRLSYVRARGEELPIRSGSA